MTEEVSARPSPGLCAPRPREALTPPVTHGAAGARTQTPALPTASKSLGYVLPSVT